MSESRTEESRAEGGVHPVDEVLPPGRLAVFGFQHVLAMYAGAVAVPLILATAIGLPEEDLVYLINADLFTCGVATLIQAVGFWKIGIRLPIVQGVTFAAVTPMVLIGESGGLPAIYGSVIVAGIVTLLVSPYFSKLLRFFPPVVTGSIITIIGVSLLPVAVTWAGGGDPTAENFGAPGNIALAFAVLLVILLIYRFFSGFVSRIAVLLGLVIGTTVATVLGVTDFGEVSEAALLGVTTPFHFGLPTFGFAAILSMVLVMLVTMVETTGNAVAVGEIVEKPIREDNLTAGLRADGLSTALGGVLNAFPYTAYAQNVGLVRLTGVKSRWVVAAAGGFLILLGLFPKLAAVVAAIPLPVLGGAGFALFGTVAATGIRTLSRVDFDRNANLVIVAVSLAVGLIPVASPTFYSAFPPGVQIVLNSGITAGSLAAIILNVAFNVLGGKEERRIQPASLPPGRAGRRAGLPSTRDQKRRYPLSEEITLDRVNELDREGFVTRYGSLFEHSPWVAEEAWRSRPFGSIEEMWRAFEDAMYAAPRGRQLDLIRAHPDLAGKAAVAGELTQESAREQASAGLDRLSPGEFEAFTRMNREYREKFGLPMVVCVREHTKESILENVQSRLRNSRDEEIRMALAEISKISHYRLLDLIEREEERRPKHGGEVRE